MHITGGEALLQARMIKRRGRVMPAGLLDSPLATLQVPEADETAINLDIAGQPDSLVEAALAFLKFHTSPETTARKPSHEH